MKIFSTTIIIVYNDFVKDLKYWMLFNYFFLGWSYTNDANEVVSTERREETFDSKTKGNLMIDTPILKQ